MKSAIRAPLAAVVALAIVGATACGPTTIASNSPSNSPSSSSSTSPSSSGGARSCPSSGGAKLDPEVSMPTGFPSNFPIYPCSRLTHVVKAPALWDMIWETRDSLDQVRTFYDSMLNQGDWSCGDPGTACAVRLPNGGFNSLIFRKSSSARGGDMQVTYASGVTKMELSLDI